jgi:hypothetical protein
MNTRGTSEGPKRLPRRALNVRDLSNEQLAAIAMAEAPAVHTHLDLELPASQAVSQKHAAAEHDNRPRQCGRVRGKIWMAEDFDAPDPEIEKLSNEGDQT